MAAVIVAGHRWTFRESVLLVEQPTSCLLVKDGSIDLCVPVARTADMESGIRDALASRLNYYCPSLGGVLISYTKLRLCSPNTDLCGIPSSDLSITIHGTFAVFQPEKGKLLKGIITRVNRNHIGCLVHKTFTASLRSSSGSDVNFEGIYNQEEEITFVVDNLVKEGFCRITGVITDDLIMSHRNALPAAVNFKNTDDVYSPPVVGIFGKKGLRAKTLVHPDIQSVDDLSDLTGARTTLKTDSPSECRTSDADRQTTPLADTVTSGQKRKSKKTKSEVPDPQAQIVEEIVQLNDQTVECEPVLDLETPKKMKKSKKTKAEVTDPQTLQPNDEIVDCEPVLDLETPRQKKKSKNTKTEMPDHQEQIVEETLQPNSQTVDCEPVLDLETPRKKKKSKRTKTEVPDPQEEIVQETLQPTDQPVESEPVVDLETPGTKKKSKKRKLLPDQDTLDEVSSRAFTPPSQLEDFGASSDMEASVKRKKSKKIKTDVA